MLTLELPPLPLWWLSETHPTLRWPPHRPKRGSHYYCLGHFKYYKFPFIFMSPQQHPSTQNDPIKIDSRSVVMWVPRSVVILAFWCAAVRSGVRSGSIDRSMRASRLQPALTLSKCESHVSWRDYCFGSLRWRRARTEPTSPFYFAK